MLEGSEDPICVTLEHAYPQEDGSFDSKIPDGEYKCVRGMHKLHTGPEFSTFEITGIEGHSNILFHQGNYNNDSEGCVLLGKDPGIASRGRMVASSKETFANFLKLQSACNEFQLKVTTCLKTI